MPWTQEDPDQRPPRPAKPGTGSSSSSRPNSSPGPPTPTSPGSSRPSWSAPAATRCRSMPTPRLCRGDVLPGSDWSDDLVVLGHL